MWWHENQKMKEKWQLLRESPIDIIYCKAKAKKYLTFNEKGIIYQTNEKRIARESKKRTINNSNPQSSKI